jgi:hemerythrin-like domain-containing protein
VLPFGYPLQLPSTFPEAHMRTRKPGTRRDFLFLSTSMGFLFASSRTLSGSEGELETPAVEDLMREHGILRRALLIYTETAHKLRANAPAVIPDALQKTARLFRSFGEDYHEKQLEEAYIFPAVRKAGGSAASYADVLVTQHLRGREITDYLLNATKGGRISNPESIAHIMDEFVLMYRNHAAREDTIVFPAWKKTMSSRQYDEMSDRFEDIEKQMFGKDGFEDAARQIGEVEESLSLGNLAQFTAAPPPK